MKQEILTIKNLKDSHEQPLLSFNFMKSESFINITSKIDIPLGVVIFVGSYLVLNFIFACFMYKRLKRYFPKWQTKYFEKPNMQLASLTSSMASTVNVSTKTSKNATPKGSFSGKRSSRKSSLQGKANASSRTDRREKLLAEDENQNLHEKYPELLRFDEAYISFWRVLVGAIFFFWIRLIFMHICFLLSIILINIATVCFSKEMNRKMSKFHKGTVWFCIQLCISPMFWVMGFITCHKKKKDAIVKEIYSKYLGENYDIEQDKSFSCYIANHHSWVEAFYWGWKYTPGFISKKSNADNFFIGTIMKSLDCVLVERENKDSRNSASEALLTRQQMFYKKETHSPILIYPEGTCTNGKYLIKFKKGAFQSLLPVKPLFSVVDDKGPGMNDTPMSTFDHFFFVFMFLYKINYYYELPVIECNDFMLKHFQTEEESDHDTFAKVSRQILAEIFDQGFSDISYKDVQKYEKFTSEQ